MANIVDLLNFCLYRILDSLLDHMDDMKINVGDSDYE